MADALERAKRDLAKKENEIRELAAEADRIRAFIEMYGRYVGPPEKVEQHLARNGGAVEPAGRARTGKKYVIADAAEELIRARAYPVPLSEIYDTLTAEGIEIGTEKPRQNLSGILHRDGRFQSLPGKGWVMKPHKEEGSEGETAEPALV